MTNVWYVKNILANCDGNMYLPILHLSRVELHCKLQEKLHRVTVGIIHIPKFQPITGVKNSSTIVVYCMSSCSNGTHAFVMSEQFTVAKKIAACQFY